MNKVYPGSKRGSGVAERIISEMPPHRIYVELFAGSAAVFEKKKRSGRSYLVESNVIQWHKLHELYQDHKRFGCQVYDMTAGMFIETSPVVRRKDTLIYADPPYLPEVVSRSRYGGAMHDADAHRSLLLLLVSIKCMVMISGYRSELYDGLLAGWRRVDIGTQTRGGPRTECVWCNFPPATRFHDNRWLGNNYRERWRIKKRAERWSAKLKAMPRDEQAFMMNALRQAYRNG